MTLTKRIIPCLDVKNGRVVKGLNFESIKDAGDPVELAAKYSDEGADELVFLDITASNEQRETIKELVRKVASVINIPFTVGGGVKSIDDARNILLNGADKVGVNTSAIKNPPLLTELMTLFGKQCVVVSIPCKINENNKWQVYTHGGREKTGLDAIKWAQQMVEYGAGELLLTSMDRDGTKKGFDIELTCKISSKVTVPVIASGGVGKLEHFADGVLNGGATGVLAASVFHFGELSIAEVKHDMALRGVKVRS